MFSLLSHTIPILSLSLLILPFYGKATPSPSSKPIFQFENEGEFPMYTGEYSSTYRYIDMESPPTMGLFMYNNTPNAYTLAIGVGFPRLWVWAANRNSPVGDGATLTLGEDGNLVLADANRRVVWQTNTANKGVTGIKLLDTGNLVLYDSIGKNIWQSFDHPSDSLMLGQSLRAGPSNKLVSRASKKSSLEGPYSLIMKPNRVSMYYKSPKSPNLLQYYTILHTSASTLSAVKFLVSSIDNVVYELTLDYSSLDGATGGEYGLGSIKYNSTYAFLRLDFDGNVRVYTYFDDGTDGIWTVESTMFLRDNFLASIGVETECQLPERCGNFGVCYKDQCVGCPSPDGLLGWSESCQPPKFGPCSGGKNVTYYKIEGVEHFTSKYTKGEGPMKEIECGNKCSKDCKCLGYFYHQETSKCWIPYDLKTLTKSGHSKHVAYIKISN